MGFGGGFNRKREFLDFLAQQGLLNNTPPPVPEYVSNPALRARGIEGNNALLTRQYGAPLDPPANIPPPIPVTPPTTGYTPTPDQLTNLFQTAPFQTYAPPGRGADFLAEQFRIANDPEIARQIAENAPLPDLGGVVDAITNIPSQIPTSGSDIGELVTQDVAPTAGDIGSTALDIYEYPLDKRKEMTGDLIYQEATTGYDAMDNGVVNWRSLVAINPTVFGLPAAFNPESALRSDEDKAEAKRIYEEAEAAGNDGGAAVWEWFIGRYGMLQRGAIDIGADPLNWTMALTPAGSAITRVAPRAGRLAPVVRTVGQALKAPEAIADAPFTVPAAIVKATRWRGGASNPTRIRQVIESNPLAQSSEAQLARDAEAEVAQQAQLARSFYEDPAYRNRAEAMSAEQAAAAEAAIVAEAEARVRGQYTPAGEPRLIPGDQGPVPTPPVSAAPTVVPPPAPIEGQGLLPGDTGALPTPVDTTVDDIMARVDQVQSDGSRVGPTPVETQPSVVDPLAPSTPPAFRADADLYGHPMRQTGTAVDNSTGETFRVYQNENETAYAVIGNRGSEMSGSGKPGVVDGLAFSPSTSSTLSTPPVAPVRAADDAEFALGANPAGTRTRDVLAREQPHVYEKVAPELDPYVRDTYVPQRQVLTKESLDDDQLRVLDTIPEAEPIPVERTKSMRGTNKAVSQILNAEYFGNMRLLTYLNGGDITNLRWAIEPDLLAKIGDPDLAAARGIPIDQTYKDTSKESYMARYLLDPTANKAELEDWLVKNRVFRRTTGASEMEQRAYARYVRAQKARRLLGPPEELDAVLAEQGLTRTPPQVNPVDMARMPKVEEVVQRGDDWTADRLDTVMRLPDSAKAPIMADVAPWAEDAYRNINVASPRTQAFTDLEFAARLRESAARHGVALSMPTSVPYDPDDLGSVIRAAVQEPDSANAERIIVGLEDIGQVRREPPVEYLRSYDIGLYAAQKMAYENFIQINSLRSRLHATASDILRTGDAPLGPPVPGEAVPTPAAPTVIKRKQFDERVQREIKKIRAEWAADPTKGVPTSGDNLIAAAFEDGRLTEDEVAELRQRITVNTGTKQHPVMTETTVFDIFITEAGKKDTLVDAVRSTNDIIAKSLRLMDPAARPTRAKRMGWRVYDKITQLYRDMYLYNPVSFVRNSFVDSIGNSLSLMMHGRPKRGIQNLPFLSPKVHWSMYKHNITGADVKHAALTAAENWDVKPGAGVIDVVTRELQNVADGTAWSPVPVVGKVMNHTQALRHSSDQANRAGLWGDLFGEELKKALYGEQAPTLLRFTGEAGTEGFYQRVIGKMGGGPRADEAVRNLQTLEKMGGFLPADVRRITGDADLMRDWRATSRQVGKNADAGVNKIFFSYRQTNFDAATRRVFMFHYWLSRALVQHTKLALSNPLLLYRYTQMWEGLDREARRQGIDEPMGPFLMYFEFMKGDGGMFGISNPIAIITPYSMFADVMTQSYGDESAFDKRLRQMGGFLLPQLQAAAVVTGISNRYPDFLGTASIRAMVRNVLDWDRNGGYGIFNLDPGITGDPVQHYFNKVLERVNNVVASINPDEINNVELPNLTDPKRDVVAHVIVENAEEDFGVKYMDMTPEQKAEVDAAIWDLREYGGEDNPRVTEALATVTDANLWMGGVNMVVPGGLRARSESQTDAGRAMGEAIDTGVSTPESDNAFAINNAVEAGSPEASALPIQMERLEQVGTERENTLYDGFNDIAYSTNHDPMAYVVIAGRIFYGHQMNQMSSDDRKKLAEAWLLDNGANMAWLDGFKTRRDKVIASDPGLASYKQYQKDMPDMMGPEVYTYDNPGQRPEYQSGGIRASRQVLEQESPNFRQMIEIERQKLIERGVTGEELEQSLDMWAIGPQGYNAYKGYQNKQSDPDVAPLIDTSATPPSLAPRVETDSGSAPKAGSSSGSSSSSSGERDMPKWQVTLVNDWQAYSTAVREFEAQYGSITNYNFNPEVVTSRIPEPSADLRRYLEWARTEQAAGRSGSMEEYLAFKDAEWEANKKKDEADEKKATEALGDMPSENKTARDLLEEIEGG